jgi:hypothetical protein
MRTSVFLCIAGCAALLAVSPGTAARGQDAGSSPLDPAPPPLHEAVTEAIDRGVAWLRARQGEDGTWGRIGAKQTYQGGTNIYPFPAGPTAFALYTLLKCGVPAKDPGIARGFAAIRKIGSEARTSYEAAATLLAIEAKYDPVKREHRREAEQALRAPGKRPNLRVTPSPEDTAWVRELVKALEDRFNEGGWRYDLPKDATDGALRDQSATAMSLLGLLAAHRCGADARRKTLVSAVEWTLAQQDATGPAAKEIAPAKPGETRAAVPAQQRGWPYVRESKLATEPKTVTGNMTTAGIVSLLAAQHILEDMSPEAARTLAPRIDRAVDDGIAWLGGHWTVDENPGAPDYWLMYLYGIERVGDLRRLRLLAGHDWYTEGAEVLVGLQRPAGEWKTLTTHEPQDVLDTCFALLFLDRASFVAEVTPK